MLFSVLALSLAGVAAASPITSGRVGPYSDSPKSQSKGFHLVVERNLTAFDGLYLTTVHVAAGTDLAAVAVGARDTARVFYQNGTLEEYEADQSAILSDSGKPLAPFGLSLVKDAAGADSTAPETISTVYLTSQATAGLQVSLDAVIKPGSFLICDEPVAYYQNKRFNILKNKLDPAEAIPKECTAITLVPECAQLNTLPEGSFSSHEAALDTECYVDAE